MQPDLFFTVQTMQVKDGKALTSIQPDKDGVYRGLPLMVLGKPSRNNFFYETESVVAALSAPSSKFRTKLMEGGLEGEWGHPCISSDADLARLTHIDRTRVSHYFNKIYTKSTEQGNTLVYSDVIASGPYGKYLDENLQDPKRNTAFSLRALCVNTDTRGGITHRKVLAMVTFDAVDAPGFEEASKRFADQVSTENMNIKIDLADQLNANKTAELLGVESFHDDQLFDMLDTDKVKIFNKVIAYVDRRNQQLVTKEGPKSVFHQIYNR